MNQSDPKVPDFAPGTVTNKTAEEFWELARLGIKAELHIDVSDIRPVFGDVDAGLRNGEARKIIGFQLVHVDPKPRAPRSDKGIPKGPRTTGEKAPTTDRKLPTSTGTGKSPFVTDSKAVS